MRNGQPGFWQIEKDRIYRLPGQAKSSLNLFGGKKEGGEKSPGLMDQMAMFKKAQEMALVIEAQSLPEREIPDYVVPDGNDKVAFTRVPKLDEVPYPVTMEPNLVVEFYSR